MHYGAGPHAHEQNGTSVAMPVFNLLQRTADEHVGVAQTQVAAALAGLFHMSQLASFSLPLNQLGN
jgi:hypothetical protein